MPSVTFQINPHHAALTEVARGLFVSGVCGLTPDLVKQHRITAIINATEEVPNLKNLGRLRYSKLWIEDDEQFNIYPHLELQSNQIDALIAAGGRVLVHSVHGVSRCATLCLAYLTKFRCKTLKDAYETLAAIRPMVKPNMGFWRQLIAFEQEVKQTHGSVRIMRDPENLKNLVPDVYATVIEPPPSTKTDKQPHSDSEPEETTPATEENRKSKTSRTEKSKTDDESETENPKTDDESETEKTRRESVGNRNKEDPNGENFDERETEVENPRNVGVQKGEKRKRLTRLNSGPSAKFQPVLETLHELLESVA